MCGLFECLRFFFGRRGLSDALRRVLPATMRHLFPFITRIPTMRVDVESQSNVVDGIPWKTFQNNGLNFQLTDPNTESTLNYESKYWSRKRNLWTVQAIFKEFVYRLVSETLVKIFKHINFSYSIESRLLEFLLMEQSIIMFRRFF